MNHPVSSLLFEQMQCSKVGSSRTYPEDQMMTENVPLTSNNRRPSLGQQPRRVSNMSDCVDNANTQAQIQGSGYFMDVDDKMSLSISKPPKKVSFSIYSSLHVYQAYTVEDRKSYKSHELKAFREQASLEATRIQEIITASPYEHGQAIRHLMGQKLLTPEELVGIDHLLCDEYGAQKKAYERLVHAKLVVKKQQELDAEALAYLVVNKSRKNTKKALIRARLAGAKGENDAKVKGVKRKAALAA